MKIFHILPTKLDVSGGVKVHYQLAALERRMGYEAYVVFDEPDQHVQWFAHDVPEISWATMKSIADRKNDLIVGWENVEPLYRSGFVNKVMYVQGSVFIDRSQPYYGLDVWFSSAFNAAALPQFVEHDTYLVQPYIDALTFWNDRASEIDLWRERPTRVLIQERKFGWRVIDNILAEATEMSLPTAQLMQPMTVLADCPEEDFAYALRTAQIFIAHSFPEGLGLPPLEAMASGCLVVGFTGGGGSDYMQHGVNSFVVRVDGDYRELAVMLNLALTSDDKTVQAMREEGRRTVNFFSAARTEAQLRAALRKYECIDEYDMRV